MRQQGYRVDSPNRWWLAWCQAADIPRGRISPYPPRVFNTIIEILVEQDVIQAEVVGPVPDRRSTC